MSSLPPSLARIEIHGRVVDLRTRLVSFRDRPEVAPWPMLGDKPVCALLALPQPTEDPLPYLAWAKKTDGTTVTRSAAGRWKEHIRTLLKDDDNELIERKDDAYRLLHPRREISVEALPVEVEDAKGIELLVRQRLQRVETLRLRVRGDLHVSLLRDEVARRWGYDLPLEAHGVRLRVAIELYVGARRLDDGATVAGAGLKDGDLLEIEGDVTFETVGGARGQGRLFRGHDAVEEHRQALLAVLAERMTEAAWLGD